MGKGEDMSNITRLIVGDKEIILIATAHVSKESAELVKQVIEEERPDSVCVELDEERYKNIQNPKSWEDTDIIKVIKTKRVGFLLANLALSSYQKKMAKKLDAPVGGEMIQGIKSAEEAGAKLVLADRSIQTTFLRIWRKLGMWEKTKLLTGLIFSFDEDNDITDEDLQDLLQEDMLKSVMASVREKFPGSAKSSSARGISILRQKSRKLRERRSLPFSVVPTCRECRKKSIKNRI